MTPDAVLTLFGSCIVVGMLLGAVVALSNSWRV